MKIIHNDSPEFGCSSIWKDAQMITVLEEIAESDQKKIKQSKQTSIESYIKILEEKTFYLEQLHREQKNRYEIQLEK